jgi:hypothetical protein
MVARPERFEGCPVQSADKIFTWCPKQLFYDKLAAVLNFDVEAGVHGERFGIDLTANTSKMEVEHFDGSNQPRAEPARSVTLNNDTTKFGYLAGAIGCRGRQSFDVLQFH